MERSTSSAKKRWPESAVIFARASKATRGGTAPGMARAFDETLRNPACVAGQVAQPDLRAFRNQRVAASWWT